MSTSVEQSLSRPEVVSVSFLMWQVKFTSHKMTPKNTDGWTHAWVMSSGQIVWVQAVDGSCFRKIHEYYYYSLGQKEDLQIKVGLGQSILTHAGLSSSQSDGTKVLLYHSTVE